MKSRQALFGYRKVHGRAAGFEQNSKAVLFQVIIIAFLLAGVIIGSVLANTLQAERFTLIYKGVDNYIAGLDEHKLLHADVLLESAVKYGKIALFIWLLGFVKPGVLAALVLMTVKGIGFGFAGAFFARVYGMDGIVYIIKLCFLQNLILIPAYIWLTYNSMRFCTAGGLLKNISKAGMFNYFVVLLIGLGCVILASVLEVVIL